MNQVSLQGMGGVVLNCSPQPGFVVQFALFISALTLHAHFAQAVTTNLKPLHFGFTAMKPAFVFILCWHGSL